MESPGGAVWGVLYALPKVAWPRLDTFEEGYTRTQVEVVTTRGTRVEAGVYMSERITDDPVPFEWYRALLLEGAREHGLPPEYVALLEELPARPHGAGQ